MTAKSVTGVLEQPGGKKSSNAHVLPVNGKGGDNEALEKLQVLFGVSSTQEYFFPAHKKAGQLPGDRMSRFIDQLLIFFVLFAKEPSEEPAFLLFIISLLLIGRGFVFFCRFGGFIQDFFLIW